MLTFEELKEMTGNEEFLRDFILNLEQFKSFQKECEIIADRTYKTA